MKISGFRPRLWLVILVLLPICSGCLVHKPDLDRPPSVTTVQQDYQELPDYQPDQPTTSQPWWLTFNDPALSQLIDTALEANLELEALAARIEQADALMRQANSELFPALDGAATFDANRSDFNDSGPNRRSEATSLGALLSWELDLWGRLRSAKHARRLESLAAIHDWLGGRLLLSASVAETYFQIREQQQQLRLIKEQIVINDTLLDLTRLRFGQGQSSVVDVLQQQEQLAATRSLVPTVETRLAQLEYSLDVLLGRTPGNRKRVDHGNLTTPPSPPPVGWPSELLEQRPDLIATQQRVVAIDYEVGEAIAARLPRFVIGGSTAAAGDPGYQALVSSAFASIVGPIFDAGRRRAEVDFRKASLREALADYSTAYLTAIWDVETALLRERKQTERVKLLNDQLRTAQQLLRETRNRYSQGLTDYLPVLAAVVTEQNLQRELLTDRRELLSFRVAVHRSVGGPMDQPENLTEMKENL